MRRIAFILVLAALSADVVDAQTVRTRIETDSLSVGARYRMVVSIRHDGSRLAVFPDEAGEAPPGSVGLVGDLELLRRISSGSRMLPDDSRLDSVLYEATTFALDTARVAAVVGLSTESDTLLFASLPGTLPVRSVVPEDAEDIRDLAPLVEFPRTWWPWLLALALAVVAGWLYLRHRRRQPEPEEPEPEEPAEPPFDEAMRRIRQLSTAAPDPDGIKPWFVELSDILRTYVARRTRVPAREMTTGELVSELERRNGLRRERIGEVRRVLTQSDLVKFADLRPAPDRAITTLEEARASIERAEADFRPVAPPSGGEVEA